MTSHDNQPPELTPDWQVDPRPDPFDDLVEQWHEAVTSLSLDEFLGLTPEQGAYWARHGFVAGMSRNEPMQIPRNVVLGEN